jgi:hypothetical protein
MPSWRATNERFTSVALSLPPNPDRYQGELLDGYLFSEDIDTPYAEYAAEGVEFTRGWPTCHGSRAFCVSDQFSRAALSISVIAILPQV